MHTYTAKLVLATTYIYLLILQKMRSFNKSTGKKIKCAINIQESHSGRIKKATISCHQYQ